MKSISEYWDQYLTLVLSPNAGEVQRMETRRAFYAGFQAALMAGGEMADESGDDDEHGVRLMQSLHDECEAFGRRIQQGTA